MSTVLSQYAFQLRRTDRLRLHTTTTAHIRISRQQVNTSELVGTAGRMTQALLAAVRCGAVYRSLVRALAFAVRLTSTSSAPDCRNASMSSSSALPVTPIIGRVNPRSRNSRVAVTPSITDNTPHAHQRHRSNQRKTSVFGGDWLHRTCQRQLLPLPFSRSYLAWYCPSI
jgi:hypothetical protein